MGGYGWLLVVTTRCLWVSNGWLLVVTCGYGVATDGYRWLRVIIGGYGLVMGGHGWWAVASRSFDLLNSMIF